MDMRVDVVHVRLGPEFETDCIVVDIGFYPSSEFSIARISRSALANILKEPKVTKIGLLFRVLIHRRVEQDLRCERFDEFLVLGCKLRDVKNLTPTDFWTSASSKMPGSQACRNVPFK